MFLRDLIDIAWLEDFASGLARAARLRVALYDGDGTLIVASAANNEFARITGHVLNPLPADLRFERVPAHDPPAQVAYVVSRGVWYVVAPVYVDDSRAGYVAVGEFRETPPATQEWQPVGGSNHPGEMDLAAAWSELPVLDRRGDAHAVVTARWGSRMLAENGRRESRLMSAATEVALVGDLADLLTDEHDLQTILDRIVAETVRVMQCSAGSMRLYDAQTNTMRIQSVFNLPSEIVGQPAFVRLTSAVDDEALQGRVVFVEDVSTDPRVVDGAEAQKRGVVSILAAGMVYRGRAVGVLRVYTNKRRRFRPAQRNLLHVVANQAAAALVHAQLVQERLKAAEMQRQLALAGELQARIIRTPPPRHPLIETGLVFVPTFHVAGDFCDFVELCDGRLAVCVADVVGKGIPASLLMATARGALRASAAACAGPAELLTRLNRLIYRDTLTNEFVTLLLVAVDPEAGRLTYCSAGHEPLLLVRDGHVEATDNSDLVLGIRPEVPYCEYSLPLRAGDTLVLYTDGACDARNFGDEVYGRERLQESVRQYAELEPQALLDNVLWDIRRFVGLADQVDDLTLVALRIKG